MSADPKISVVIPAYNVAAYLPETIDSVLAQTYRPHEVIVVNDGSTDNTDEVLRPYEDRIIHLKQSNAGLPCARNAGIEQATGDWVGYLDGDDVWVPHKLERQIELLRGKKHVCVHSNFYVFGEEHYTPPPHPEILRQQYDLESLLIRFWILPSTALVRRSAVARFRPWARTSEDTLYFLDMLPEGTFGFLNEPLVGYRKRPGSLTRKVEAPVLSYEIRRRWLWEHEDLSHEARQEIERKLFQRLGEEIVTARWSRDWQRYWRLRQYLGEVWTWPDPPAVLSERVYPRWVYGFKDLLDGLLRRGARGRVAPSTTGGVT